MTNQETLFYYSIRIGLVFAVTLFLYLGLLLSGIGGSSAGQVTIYAYSDMLSKEVFADFEQETGITVNVKHFEAVEEVTAKLMFANEEGVDIVAPTDAMVEVLRHEGYLLPLNKKLLPSFSQIDSRLLGHYYDSTSRYSVPFCWSPVAIGYDTRVITVPPEQIEWDLIFGVKRGGQLWPPSVRYGFGVDRVCLGEDPWEVMFLAAHYLYSSIQGIDTYKQEGIVQLLRQQKQWLECYTNNLKYFLISGVCAAVVMPAAYMVMMQEEYPWADFVIPASGGAVFIGNLMIPKTCKNVAAAHKVIEFLISKQGGYACFEEHSYNPANVHSYELLPTRVSQHKYIFPNTKLFKKLHIFHNQVPLRAVEQMWHAIKL